LVGWGGRAAAGPQVSGAGDVADLPPMRKPLLPNGEERTVRWLFDPSITDTTKPRKLNTQRVRVVIPHTVI
jgi:hypothetical protein